MRFKIVALMIGCRASRVTQEFERDSLMAASQFHGEFWNTRYAWSHKFRSTMYSLNDQSRRWHKAETINWGR
jgi:hypothetical protein